MYLKRLNGHLHKYIENNIVFKENALIELHIHVVFISFSVVYTKTTKTIENGENQMNGNLLFVCQDNLWLLLHCF